MLEFLLAVLVFLAAHILPAATGLRACLIDRFGRRSYIAAYSLLSLASIAWVIAAALAAPYIEIWPRGRTTALVPILAMLPACILLAGAALQPAPLSVSFRGGLPNPGKAGVVATIRHPILWAFFLWSAAHLVANGDLVSLILFGSLAIFSLAGRGRLERRARLRLSEADYALALSLTSGGLAARLKRTSALRSLGDLCVGILLYVALLHLHDPVIGVAPLAYFA